jgi:hypothetical protein
MPELWHRGTRAKTANCLPAAQPAAEDEMKIYTYLPALATVAVLTALSPAAQSRVTADTPAPVITLRVVNEAGVDLRALRAAQKEAVATLEHSGIHLVWLNCQPGRADWGSSNPCYRDRGPDNFWLRIVARKPAAASGEMLGFTELDEIKGSAAAGVYYPAVEQLAQHWSVPAGAILGAAIAHEVGHLVLGANAHSRRGVMCAHWVREQFVLIGISGLHFNPDQSRAIRERITDARSLMP